MTQHDGRKFSTKDISGSNCANTYKGAWWYNACHFTHLNGMNYQSQNAPYGEGINYYHWKGFGHSLASVSMSIKALP